MLGMIGFGDSAPVAVVFYSAIYLLMNLVVFAVVLELERMGEDPTLANFQGLYKRNALMALALLVALFSLAGVPPLAGFFGKWLLFSSAAQGGHIWFVAFAILNSVLSLYYYLFLVKAAYFGEVPKEAVSLDKGGSRLAILVTTIAIALLGMYPRILTEYIGRTKSAGCSDAITFQFKLALTYPKQKEADHGTPNRRNLHQLWSLRARLPSESHQRRAGHFHY